MRAGALAWAGGALLYATCAFDPGACEAANADRSQLWMLVNLKCLRHLAKSEAPIPCDSVDTRLGWDHAVALLKDRLGAVRELVIPAYPVTGIEDPALLAPGEPNFFAIAWSARAGFRMQRLGISPGALAVAVDSKDARDQDQLHLIVDCLDPVVATAIADQAAWIDDHWRPMSVALKGRTYWARKVESARPEDVWPFQLLINGLPGAKADLGAWSLAMTQPASLRQDTYILLADRAEGGIGGRARDLMDQTCALTGK